MQGLVIVTGGSRGIGAAICRRVARDGYAVAVNYASRPELAEAVAGEITAAGGRAAAFRADVADETQVHTLFAAAQDRLGPLVGLVNNAGITGGATRFEDLSVDALRRTLDINVVGTVLCARRSGSRHVHATRRARRRDRQPVLGRGPARWTRRDRALRAEQGRHRHVHARAGPRGGRGGDPGQRGRPGADRHGDEPAGPSGPAGAGDTDQAGGAGRRDRRGGGLAALAGCRPTCSAPRSRCPAGAERADDGARSRGARPASRPRAGGGRCTDPPRSRAGKTVGARASSPACSSATPASSVARLASTIGQNRSHCRRRFASRPSGGVPSARRWT